jgi:outer membrane protein insertion porin family
MSWTRIAIFVAVLSAPAPARADGTFELGAGFSTDEGFLASAKVEQDDLFHTGQLLSLEARLSARLQEFTLVHEWGDLHTELVNRRRVYQHHTRTGTGGSLQYGRDVGAHTRVYLRYRAEAIDVEHLGAERSALAPEDDHAVVSALGAGLLYEANGTRLELYGERADPRLGSTYDYVRLTASLQHERPLGPFTLRARGNVGWIHMADGSPVPWSERFQHDGWADLAGYRWDAFGDEGADFEATGRVELELPVWRKAGLSVAAFADAGVLGTALHRSVGVSVLWRSPIGKLRFDWAIPLDGDDAGAVLFGFGF